MSQPTYSPEAATYYKLNLIKAFIQFFGNLEGQDAVYTMDAVEAMLTNVQSVELIDMINYVHHYCNVADGPEDCDRIAGEILSDAQDMPNPFA